MAVSEAALTEDQIDRLLREAEERLSNAQDGQIALTTGPSDAAVAQQAEQALAPAAQPSSSAPSMSASQEKLSVRVPQAPKSRKEQATKADAGPAWFNMPKTDLERNPELRKDLQLLKMRSVLDPKRHYRKDNAKSSVPEYCQVGTMVAGPTERHTLTRKERKRTLLEEVLETEDSTRRFKSKYSDIQAAKTSGKKGHYKKMMQRRYGRKG